MTRFGLGLAVLLAFASGAHAQPNLAAATLPSTRSVEAGAPATLFAAIQNSGDETAQACRIAIDEGFTGPLDLEIGYQTTNAQNQLSGTPNTPVDIPAGQVQTFLISILSQTPVVGAEIGFTFVCDNARAAVSEGVNTLFLTVSEQPAADIIPIIVTASSDGVARVPVPGGDGFFAAAAVNIGAAQSVRVTADTGRHRWPIELALCETDQTGQCQAPPGASVETAFATDQVRFFTVFIRGDETLGVPFLPDVARVFLRFEDPSGGPLGASSTAVVSPDGPVDLRALDLDAAAAWAQASGARALVIQRDAETLFENYWGFGGPDAVEFLASGTKSFSCASQALARDLGLFNPDDYAHIAIPSWAPDGSDPDRAIKQLIRGRDLLTLAHGIPPRGAGGLSAIDSYAEAITTPPVYAVDRHAIYGRPGFQAFSAVFDLRTGGVLTEHFNVEGGLDAASLVQTHVLDRIGAPAAFGVDARGEPNFTSGAVTTARHWARYGRLILDDGVWEGERVLSPSSVRRCLHYWTPAFGGYGLSFWLNRPVGGTYQPFLDSLPGVVTPGLLEADRLLPAAPSDLAVAWGAGNMQLFIIRSQRLVIVKFGGAGDQNGFFQALYGPDPAP